MTIPFFVCQTLAKVPRRQLYQGSFSKILLAYAIVSAFGGWLWDGPPKWGSLWMVHPFVLAPKFVSATPSMDILFPILGRNEVSTCWSSFLIFLCFGSCILGILGFWANIHLSVSTYQVTSFVIGLPHSGWYFLVPSICLRILKIHWFFVVVVVFCLFVFVEE